MKSLSKTLLCLLLLCVIFSRAAAAPEERQAYRFGEWTLLLPPALQQAALEESTVALAVPATGLEVLAYWQDGKQRAVAIRFDATDAKRDTVVLKSFGRANRLKACRLGMAGSIKAAKDVVPKGEIAALPAQFAAVLAGTGAAQERSLKREGELLIFDMGSARVQLADDSPVLRLGEWGSAEFCRFGLKPAGAEDEREEDLLF